MNLKQLLGICEHKWKAINGNDLLDEDCTKVGYLYHLQCEKCGIIRGQQV